MKDYEQIHQHIQYALEQREINPSLFQLFQKHKSLSFNFWKLVSFFVLLPYSISNIFSFKNILTTLAGENVNSSDPMFVLLFYTFSIVAFTAPILISSILLTQYLPLYKLSQKKFFKKHLGKYLRKFPILASSCDTIHYKEDFLLDFSNDTEFNLSMSSYYQYLLQFPFSEDIKKSLAHKQEQLSHIELNPEKYQKNFVSIVTTFLSDFDFYSKSPVILKDSYQTKLYQHSSKIFCPDFMDDIEEDLDKHNESEKDSKKKLFKEML